MYDQEEHGHAYGQGCRAAERERGGDSADAKWPRHRSPVGIPNVAGMEPAAAGRARKGYDEAMTRRRGGESVGAQAVARSRYRFVRNSDSPDHKRSFALRMLSFWLLVTSRSAVTEALSETCRPSRIVKEF
jgi:hypothetical protein